MSMHQQAVQRAIKRKTQKDAMLVEVRAKAFELQTALSDLLEFLNASHDQDYQKFNKLMAQATVVRDEAGRHLKGA